MILESRNNMDLCSHHHDEIVYNEHKCPLCRAKEEIAVLTDKVVELEAKVDELNNQ